MGGVTCLNCSCPCHRQTLPSRSADFRGWTLHFNFAPKVDGRFNKSIKNVRSDWLALLSVKVADMPRLMREGFHWNGANFCMDEGYLEEVPEARRLQNDMTVARHYTLTDLSDEPNWHGTLMVSARNFKVLSTFRVSDLSPDQTLVALGTKTSGQYVYHYSAENPDKNFNAIYDDMPMEGWWPWPKREPGSTSNKQGKD